MIIRTEDPGRAAAALADLEGTEATRGPGGAWTVGMKLRVLPGAGYGAGVERLVLPIGRSVEQVIEIACEHGFHAEELARTGFVEFWIAENMLVELVTADARIRPSLAA